MTDENSSTQKKNPGSSWAALAIFVIFLVWGYYYLFTLRPMMNQSLAGSIGSYPAFLHLIPILAVPIFCGVVIDFIYKLLKKK